MKTSSKDDAGAGGRDGNVSMGGIDTSPGPGGSSADGGPIADAGTAEKPCVNLQCRQVTCPAGAQTTISGTTFAPNGKLPLFNVAVYVPNAALEPFTIGVSCERCGRVSGRPIASTISNEEGKFKISGVPVGKDIPLVFQVGKWRRQVTIPNVTACQNNPIADANLTRLPRNRTEGDIPRIAVTTGQCDRLGCLLPKIGLDAGELGVAGQSKVATFYQGYTPAGASAASDGPPNMDDVTSLWRNEAELSKYDMALMSCECSESLNNKGPAAYDAVTKYLAKGGRIFGTDFMYVWYQHSPDPRLARALSIVGGAEFADNPMLIDVTFPKGKALGAWMKFVDPMTPEGLIWGEVVFKNFTAAMPASSRVWATSAPVFQGPSQQPRIVTINTPAGVPDEQQCGRAVHIDAHISTLVTPPRNPNGSAGAPVPFPASCEGDLKDAEIALAFLFFDLGACIQSDETPVVPPIIVP